MQTTGAQPKLALGRIAKFVISIPRDIGEQLAIAEVMSDVDGLIGALDALIAKKQAIKRAAMQQLLTGRTRLPGFSGSGRRSEYQNLVILLLEKLPALKLPLFGMDRILGLPPLILLLKGT